MNKTVQFGELLAGVTTGVPRAVLVPLKVPDKLAFRLRWVEFCKRDYGTADEVTHLGLSRLAVARVKSSVGAFVVSTDFLARECFGFEVTGAAGTGLSGQWLVRRFEMWDADYRLVMPPAFHLVNVGQVSEWTCFIHGEFVPITMGDRNGVIAWQGGAKNA